MKKAQFILLSVVLLLSNSLSAQEPGKFKIISGQLKERYTIGDQYMNKKQVHEHLIKHDTDAAHYFKLYKSNKNSAIFWSLFGTAGLVAGFTSKNTSNGLGLVALGFVGYAGATAFSIVGNKNKRRALKKYNTKYGY